MRAKTYLIWLVVMSGCFVLFHMWVWKNITAPILAPEKGYVVGDMGRMSYALHSLSMRLNEFNLSHRHIHYSKDQGKIDCLTIGDSFSNGGGKGLNAFYQDRIASQYEMQVMNIQPLSMGVIETVLQLLYSGVLDRLQPQFVLLEMVERSVIGRLANPVQWEQQVHLETLEQGLSKRYLQHPPKNHFINASNYNALLYTLLYRYDDNAYISKIYRTSLKEPFFSVKDASTLLFYRDDLSRIPHATPEAIDRLNANLNQLQGLLAQKGIQLIFMPVVDKYNLYSAFIPNNPYPKSHFFERLRHVTRTYTLIDTKAILRQALHEGVKDLYYADDTHWSYKASQRVVDELPFR